MKNALLAAALLAGTSSAIAAPIAPAAQGTVSIDYDLTTVDEVPTCLEGLNALGGSAGNGAPAMTGTAGVGPSAAAFKANFEFALSPSTLRPSANVRFTADAAGGETQRLCVYGYRGDGAITEADFYPEGAVLLGMAGLRSDPDFIDIDVSDFLAEFRPGLGSNILGIQLALEAYTDIEVYIDNAALTVTSGRVPEPGAVGLLGLGLIGVAAARSRRRMR